MIFNNKVMMDFVTVPIFSPYTAHCKSMNACKSLSDLLLLTADWLIGNSIFSSKGLSPISPIELFGIPIISWLVSTKNTICNTNIRYAVCIQLTGFTFSKSGIDHAVNQACRFCGYPIILGTLQSQMGNYLGMLWL